jgi:toxin ParE1/3/4
MTRLALSTQAYLDVEGSLTDLTVKAGPLIAAKYDGIFERIYDRLVEHPNSGARRPILGENVRIAVAAPFIVIYKYGEESDVVTVLRIVDGRRRISGRLLPRG